MRQVAVVLVACFFFGGAARDSGGGWSRPERPSSPSESPRPSRPSPRAIPPKPVDPAAVAQAQAVNAQNQKADLIVSQTLALLEENQLLRKQLAAAAPTTAPAMLAPLTPEQYATTKLQIAQDIRVEIATVSRQQGMIEDLRRQLTAAQAQVATLNDHIARLNALEHQRRADALAAANQQQQAALVAQAAANAEARAETEQRQREQVELSGQLSVGRAGKLPGAVRIVQVLNKSSMLVSLNGDQVVQMNGVPTAGLADNTRVELPGRFTVTGTTMYPTPLGTSNTVFVLQPAAPY